MISGNKNGKFFAFLWTGFLGLGCSIIFFTWLLGELDLMRHRMDRTQDDNWELNKRVYNLEHPSLGPEKE